MISPLILAAATNNLREVERLLAQDDINVNETSPVNLEDLYIERGDTALTIAALQRNYDIVARLLEAGADVNIKNRMGNTALHIATLIGYAHSPNAKRIIKALVDISGVELNTMNNRGDTPLINAVRVPESFDIEVIKMLLDAGADVNLRAVPVYPVYHNIPVGYTALDEVLRNIRSLRSRAETLRYDVDVALEERLKQVALLLISYGARSMQPDILTILSHQSIKNSMEAGAFRRRKHALLSWHKTSKENNNTENNTNNSVSAALQALRNLGYKVENKRSKGRRTLKQRKASTTRRRHLM